MLADPPIVYSVVFDPANFPINGEISKYAILNGANNYEGQNSFNNNTIVLKENAMDVSFAKVELNTVAQIQMVDSLNTTVSTLGYVFEQGIIENIVGGVKKKSIAIDGTIIQQFTEDGLFLNGVKRTVYANTLLTNNSWFLAPLWTSPLGPSVAYIVYNATNLPAYINYRGDVGSSLARCIWIPAPTDVPIGTTFRVHALTGTSPGDLASAEPFWISIQGGNSNSNAITPRVNTFCYSDARWPLTPTTIISRNNIQLSYGQSIAFISASHPTDGRIWLPFPN